jgi:hypothetical protein
MEIKVNRGKILVYRVFDIGSEIDLEKVESLFQDKKFRERFRLDRKHNMSLVISRAPVSIQLGSQLLKVQDREIMCEMNARVWHFGTLSLSFEIPIEPGTSWSDLIRTASWVEKEQEIDLIARTKAQEFREDIRDAIPVFNDWNLNEDYVTYFIQEFENLSVPLARLPEQVDIPALILAEPMDILSDYQKRVTMENVYQYSKTDLVVVDWNSALVVEPSGSMDVPLVIEFALNQLLEMRYYDDVLDQRLNTLYNEVVGRKRGLLSNKYSRIAEEAGQFYLEISEIVENVENSFKAVGDFYLATIFRATSKRFRFDDWQRSINEKLNNLAEVSKLLHSEVNEGRNQTLEMIIVILIAIEVVPFVYNLLVK